MLSMPTAYNERTCPANVKKWSAQDVGTAWPTANWRFRIMCIASLPASAKQADRKDLKLSIGPVTRSMARSSCSTMLLRYVTWRIKIGAGVDRINRRLVSAALVHRNPVQITIRSHGIV